MSKMKIAEARSTKALMKHPVFEQEYDFKTKYGLNLSEDRVFELKKIFAIANQNKSGVIGRKQFTDLMALLRISPTEVRANQGETGGFPCGAWLGGRGGEGRGGRLAGFWGAWYVGRRIGAVSVRGGVGEAGGEVCCCQGLTAACARACAAGGARQDDDRDGRER